MKKLILFVVAALALFLSVEASAKKSKEEKENENVIEVTMRDGSVEKGRVTTYWTYPMKKGYSRTFKIKTDDGRDIKFDVTDIDSTLFPTSYGRTVQDISSYACASPQDRQQKQCGRVDMCGRKAFGACSIVLSEYMGELPSHSHPEPQ